MKPFEKMFEDANAFNPDNAVIETVTDSQIFGDTDADGPTVDAPPPPQTGQDGNPMQGPAEANQNAFNPQQSQTVNLGVLPTEIAISVIDKAGSTLVAVVCRLAGLKVKAKQLEFSAKEKDAMVQPTEALLKSMNVVMSPLSQFALVMGAIYAAKVMAIVDIDRESKPNNLADKNELNGNTGTTTTGTRAKRGPYKKTARKR